MCSQPQNNGEWPQGTTKAAYKVNDVETFGDQLAIVVDIGKLCALSSIIF
jgi:hypothetical protein